MAETSEQLTLKLAALIQPAFRGRLTARGMGRATVWRDGIVPSGSPNFGSELSQELLSYGFGLLRVGLKALAVDGARDPCLRAFELAAESLESVAKNGDPSDPSRGFYRIVAAASYHLARYSARSYSLLEQSFQQENLSISERGLGLLILRKLNQLHSLVAAQLTNPERSDERVTERLNDPTDALNVDDALVFCTDENYLRALANFLFALRTGDQAALARSLERLRDGEGLCFQMSLVSMWWVYRITRFLIEDLWRLSVQRLLPTESGDSSAWPRLRELFVTVLAQRNTAELDLWPSQIEAASRVLNVDDDIVAALPTSSGKTRIAEISILRSLSLGKRVVVVTPLRALSAQTERTLRRTFRPLGFDVSSLYGSAGASAFDLDSLSNRQIVISTPEKLDFALRNDPGLLDDVGLIVLDEGHMLGPNEREVRYEVLIQRLLRRHDAVSRRIVCLSAMLPSGPELDDFVAWLRTDNPGGPISSDWRPTRQRFGEIVWNGTAARYELRVEDTSTSITRFTERRGKLGPRGGRKVFPKDQNDLVLASAWRLVDDGHSVLVYCPERRSVGAIAKRLLQHNKDGFLTALSGFDRTSVTNAVSVGQEWLGAQHPAVLCLSLGVAIHHGGLPKAYLREIDGLIHEKRIKVVIASPTLSRGLNISASCVLFQSFGRFDQSKGNRIPISPEEFSNVAGRAGRAYVDLDGQVLGVCFTSRHLSEWRSLVGAQLKRKLESGLISVMIPLLDRLSKKVKNGKGIVEYVLNNSHVWDEPKAVENELNEWRAAIATLDIAILSLIGDEDCGPDDVSAVLDHVLELSFLRRRLKRYKEGAQRLFSAILSRRALDIARATSVKQRRGYFFAGLGLSAGKFLDANAQQLNKSWLAADKAIRENDTQRCISALLQIAEIVFQVEPFKPHPLPGNWKHITRGWLEGRPMVDLQALSEDAPEFIESGIVYRLAWAVEAIRVRSRANEEIILSDKPSAIVAAIETGTLSIPQSVLLQAGLSSRVGAAKALNDFPGHFDDIRGMRRWLFSRQVEQASVSRDWPTRESHSAWWDFILSQSTLDDSMWRIHEFDLNAYMGNAPNGTTTGGHVLVWQPSPEQPLKIFNSEMYEIGKALGSPEQFPTPWAFGWVVDDNTIRVRLVGPRAR